jgi:hypothetical protein
LVPLYKTGEGLAHSEHSGREPIEFIGSDVTRKEGWINKHSNQIKFRHFVLVRKTGYPGQKEYKTTEK